MKPYNEDYLLASDRQERSRGIQMGEQLFALVCGFLRREMQYRSLSSLAVSVAIAHFVAMITRHIAYSAYSVPSEQVAYMTHVLEETQSSMDNEMGVLNARHN